MPKNTLCPICLGDIKTVRNLDNYTLLQCLTCSFAFFPEEQYSKKEIIKQYQENTTSTSEYYQLLGDTNAYNSSRRIEFLSQHVSCGRILDVGASTGDFLLAAKKKGWDVCGIEPNSSSCDVGKSKGIDVKCGFFEEEIVAELGGKFDVIHMGDVIEHVFDPVKFLKLAKKLLKPGGIVMIVTPDYNSLIARLLQTKPLEHVIFFTEKSLQLALKNAGFNSPKTQSWTTLRNPKALEISTTFSSTGKLIIKLLNMLGITRFICFVLYKFFKDEIIATANF